MRMVTRFASVSLLAGVLAAGPRDLPAETPLLPENLIIKIDDQVYVIPDQGKPLVPNVGILVGDDSVLVIDTGMGPRNGALVLNAVRKITSKPVRYLVTTHFHPEHNFGAQVFPEETLVIFSIAQRNELFQKGRAYADWFVDLFGDDVRDLLEDIQLVPPDIAFLHKAELDLGNLPVELHHFGEPAHTLGDTIVYLPRQRILFAGDLTPHGSFPIMADSDSSGEGWIASLERLQKMDIEILVPSHGDITDKSLIATVNTYLEDLRLRVRELHQQNTPLKEIQSILLGEFKNRYPSWQDPHWINNAVENFHNR